MGVIENNFTCFTKRDQGAYDKYLKVKYHIFYCEFGWKSLRVDVKNEMAIPDQIDKDALFFGCFNNNNLIGVARVVYSNVSIPYKDLYYEYIANGMVQGIFAVVNAIAVVKEYRGKRVCKRKRGPNKTIGEQLINNIENKSIEMECKSLILTAGCNCSENFFHRLGYRRLGECYEKSWSPEILVDCKKVLI